MNRNVRFILVFTLFAFLNGCASSCGNAVVETNSNTETNKNVQVIVPKKADNANLQAASNGNGKTVPYPGLENTNGKVPNVDNTNIKKIDEKDIKEIIPTRKMADNSEMSVRSVGADFIETRKFSNDPQLDKVERIINGTTSKYKVYLKNGKTFEPTEEKLKDYKSLSAAVILAAVGVKSESGVNRIGRNKGVQ